MKCLLSTIWHSGTHSAQELLNQTHSVVLSHCNEATAKMAKGIETYTTYRNPVDVAISWSNRERFKKYESQWYEQWKYWEEIASIAKIITTDTLQCRLNTHKDKYGLYEDRSKIYDFVSPELIGYAESIAKKVLTDRKIKD